MNKVNKRRLEIVVDDREGRAKDFVESIYYWLNDPQFHHFDVTFERLEVCDMICRTKTRIGTTGIEIKRGEDFIDSVFDGRYPNQVIQMKNQENLDNIIFIFVGNIEEIFNNRNIKPSSYYGATASLSTKYQCSILPVPDDNSAVLQSFYCFKHSDLIPNSFITKKIKINGQELQKVGMSIIPGIGNKLAISILQRYSFGKVAYMCYDNPKLAIRLLSNIKGISRGKAQIIVDFMTNPDFEV